MSGAHDTHAAEATHGGAGAYAVGFGLSLLLTALPFGLVMARALPAGALFPTVAALSAVQIVVHLLYFLHVRTPWAERWERRALGLTVVIVAIVISGSIWVLKELDDNMMPMPAAMPMHHGMPMPMHHAEEGEGP